MRASLCIKSLILCFFLKTKSFCSNQLPCLLSTIYNSLFLPSPVILLTSGLLLIAVSPPGIDVLPSTVLSASNWWVGLLKVKDETCASRRYMDSDKVINDQIQQQWKSQQAEAS